MNNEWEKEFDKEWLQTGCNSYGVATKGVVKDMFERLLQAEREKQWKLPEHKGELSITHNGHKSSYESIEDYLAWMKVDDEDINPEDRKKCIETDEIWECQWYPDTPVGFYKIYAPTLTDLLTQLNQKV